MNPDEKLALAEEKARKAVDYRNRLLIIRTAEAEIPELHDTGEVTITALAKQYGISHATVKRILRDAGRKDTRFRKLNHDERAEVAALIRQGRDHDHIAATYQISRNTVRRIGLAAGAITPGRRKQRRSDQEYMMIAEFDAEARARFNGAGLYNLGMGLRQWQRRRGEQIEALERANDTRFEPSPPQPIDEVPDPREEPAWAEDLDELDVIPWVATEEALPPDPASAPPDLIPEPLPEPAKVDSPTWQF